MIEYKFVLYNKSPLALHARRSRTQFTPCLDYIPGSTIRGAAAVSYLQTYGTDAEKDKYFSKLFMSESVLFGDLLPTKEDTGSRLLPATARLCKRYGWDHANSLTDSLLRLNLIHKNDTLDPIKDKRWKYCQYPDCHTAHNERERTSGYSTPNYKYKQVPVKMRLVTGTSINRTTGTAQMKMLFSHLVLAEKQYFQGVVRILDNEKADDLYERLKSALNIGKILRIGAARTRGMGLVRVEDWQNAPSTLALEDRWTDFNQAATSLWEHYGSSTTHPCFSLTLESHLILQDKAGRPITRLDGQESIEELFGFQGVVSGRHVIVPALVQGWNALQGLPKEAEPALGRGSVLFFWVEKGDVTVIQKRLEAIERDGIGRRRSEGFGRIRVCDPFHYVFVEDEMEGTQL